VASAPEPLSRGAAIRASVEGHVEDVPIRPFLARASSADAHHPTSACRAGEDPVERRLRDPDLDVSGGEIAGGEVADAALDAIVETVGDEGPEG